MAGSLVERMMEMLERQGFVDVILPFLLIFTIMFAMLQKTQILGEGKKNFNVIVSLVTSLLVVIPHVTGRYPVDADPVVIINTAIPQVSLIIVAIIFLLIMLGVFGQDKVFLGMAAPGWVLAFSLIIITIIFGSAAGWFDGKLENWLTRVFGPDAIAIFIMIAVFAIIISFITRDPQKPVSSGIDLNKLYSK